MVIVFNCGGDLDWQILMKSAESAKISTRQNKYT